MSVTFARAAQTVVRREQAVASATARFLATLFRPPGPQGNFKLASFRLVDAELAGRRRESANLRLTRSHVVFKKIATAKKFEHARGSPEKNTIFVFRLRFLWTVKLV